MSEIRKAMNYAKADPTTKQTYDEFLRVMVYDMNAPSFEDAFSRFYQTLNIAIPNLTQ